MEGSKMTSEEAVQRYGWLVRSLAKRSALPGIDVNDLVQEGFLGLLKAVEDWKPSGGYSFKTFAGFRIRNSIRNFLNDYQKTVSMDTDGPAPCGHPLFLGQQMHEDIGAPAEQEESACEFQERLAVVEAVFRLSTVDRQTLSLWVACHQDSSERGRGGASGSVYEMSRRLGVPRTTLRNRCERAFKRLREELSLGVA
jgi:RNA polymerase sigma factor (sigma-70 family)